MTVTMLDDHKKPDGSIDWDSYNKAEIANGEKCYRCGHWILFGTGYQRLCPSCERLDKDHEEVESEEMLRCPHCAHQRHVDWEDRIFEEGEHSIYCDSCEKDFEISTRVECHFTSPPLDPVTQVKEEEEEENDDTV
jgi:uncharacterized protein YbaR (Trm112 family)